jgi:hypothetical protein
MCSSYLYILSLILFPSIQFHNLYSDSDSWSNFLFEFLIEQNFQSMNFSISYWVCYYFCSCDCDLILLLSQILLDISSKF